MIVTDSARIESTRIYSASEAAQRLGVSVGMLRRYALAYEEQGGDITIDPQRGRRYTEAQVEALERARAFVQANPGVSVEDGVRAALGGDARVIVRAPPSMPGELAIRDAVAAAVRPVVTEALEPLLERLQAQQEEIIALREQVRALPAPHENGKVKYVCLLERRNTYLEGELKRRDEQAAPRQPWWKVWG